MLAVLATVVAASLGQTLLDDGRLAWRAAVLALGGGGLLLWLVAKHLTAASFGLANIVTLARGALTLLLLALLGIFQLGLPCMLLVIASRTLLAPEIALLGLLEVVLGPLWAWLGAGEAPGQATLVGGALVLLALVGNEISAFRGKPV